MEADLVDTVDMTIPPSFAEIDVQGADAATFLHSQLANDVRGLNVGQWRFGAYCQVDGRVQTLFLCARVDHYYFRLLLPADNVKDVEARLTRFRIRARCTISARAVSIEDATDSPNRTRYECSAFRWSVLESKGISPPMPDHLWSAQITLGVPWLFDASRDEFLPAMLALERLQAFSLRKGCYPGQEILARTHYLGRSKRRLARLAPGAVTSGTILLDSEGIQRAVAVCSDVQSVLAVVHESAKLGSTLIGENMTTKIVSEIDEESAVMLNDGTLIRT